MLLNYTKSGAGPPLVLLHGLAGSLRYWEDLMPELSQKYTVIAMDLLGFGRSPHPSSVTYNYDTHIESILETLTSLGLHNQPIHLVGHSTGALLALRLASMHPEFVERLSLISLPVYTDPAEARVDITRGKKLKDLAYFGPSSHILCTTWCQVLQPVSRRIAPLYLPGLPKHVAQDSVLHTWKSYSETLHNIVMDQAVQTDLKKTDRIPINVIYGTRESATVLNNYRNLTLSGNTITNYLSGGHNIAIDNPVKIMSLIKSP